MQAWEVVGGKDKGGIVVRTGQSLTSSQSPDRLSTGAIVKELALDGERLHYELVSGSGPSEGWVSLRLKASGEVKDLLVRRSIDDLDEEAAVKFAGAAGGASRDASGEGEYVFMRGGSVATGKTPWIRLLGKAKPDAKARLICFSWTGNRGGQGSAHSFMKPASPKWAEFLRDFEPYEINWTGRGARMKEPRIEDCARLSRELSSELAKAIAGGKPCVFLGFSFGAIVAFECARALQRDGVGPMCLVVASAEGPQFPGRAQMGLASLSDSAFEQVLAEKGGTDFILKGDPGMKAMLLPVIKSDVILEETYRYDRDRPGLLQCPVLAFCGDAEGHDKMKSIVSPEDAGLWMETTSCSAASSVSVIPSDWYVFQSEVGCERVARAIAEFCGPKLS